MCERCRCFLIDSLDREPRPNEIVHKYIHVKNVRRNAARIATLVAELTRLVKPAELEEAKQISAWQAIFCTTPQSRSLHIYTNLVRFKPALKNELDYIHCEFTDMSLYKYRPEHYVTEPLQVFMYECILPLIEVIPIIHAEHTGAIHVQGLPPQTTVADEYNGLYS